MEKRRVVITGMGAVTPLGYTVQETWDAVRAGACGIAPITLYDHSSQKVSLAAEVKDFDPTRVLDKKEARRMDRFTQFAVTAAVEAMAQSGLDLDVIDHYNGSERSADTLSGGEAFLASLALALGLSDEVQASAGGIRMDTLFVDEGFGSLSENALELAMKALTGLSEGNRLVGIISHVSELKERIDRQIVVTKDRTGGSRAEIRY